MDWGKVVESAIGTFTGGAIALASMWIKEMIDKRKAAQTWYEQYYITEGIDRLLSHVKFMHVQITTLVYSSDVAAKTVSGALQPGVERMPKSETHEAYPVDALVRIETLLGDDQVTAMITMFIGESDYLRSIPPEKRSQILMGSALLSLRTLYGHLKTIREELLKAEVKKKSDIRDVHKAMGIKNALAELDKFNEKWVAGTTMRDQLIAQGK